MSNRSVASTSTSQLRNSTRSSSNSSNRHHQSIQNSMDSLTLGVKDGRVSQRRTGSNSRISVQSQSRRTTPLLERRTLRKDVTSIADDTTNEGQNHEHLNTSTTSTATEQMDTSHQQEAISNESTTNNNNVRSTKGLITKDQLIENFFIRLNTGGYICKLCQGAKDEQKVHKQVSNSDANLRSHLARRHRRDEFLYPSQRVQYKPKVHSLSFELKRKLNKALVHAIIKDGRPFGDFRKAGFQQFLRVAFPGSGYKGPHRLTVKNHIMSLYTSYRRKLREKLALVSDLALTTDSWTNNRRTHFVCITAHYLDQDFSYKSLVLCFRRFAGRALGIRIRQFIRSELRKLNVSAKIRSITTDNGSNVKLATETNEFGFRISCLAHNLNLTVINGLGLWEKSSDSDQTRSSQEDDDDDNDKYTAIADGHFDDYEWDDDDDSSSDSDELTNEPGQSTDCDDDGGGVYGNSDSESDQSDDDAHQEVQIKDQKYLEQEVSAADSKALTLNLMKRTRGLVSMIHHSSIIENYVRDQILLKQQESSQRVVEDGHEKSKCGGLMIDVCVRWNSSYFMLNRFLYLRSIINDITHTPAHIGLLKSKQESKLSKFAYSHSDWNWLIAMETVLKPFENATRILSGRSYQTLAIKRIVMNGLKKFLITQKPTESIINILKKQLLEEYHKHCELTLSKKEEEAIMISSFLNPTTYYCLRDDASYLDEAKRLIVIQCRHEGLSTSLPLVSSSSITISNPTKQPTKSLSAIESFFSHCDLSLPSKSTVSNSSTSFTIEEEIGFYVSSIDETTNFECFWQMYGHRLPQLSRLVRRFCIMTATSVASESAFSVAGYLQRKQRSSLTPTTLRYCMLLRDYEISDD